MFTFPSPYSGFLFTCLISIFVWHFLTVLLLVLGHGQRRLIHAVSFPNINLFHISCEWHENDPYKHLFSLRFILKLNEIIHILDSCPLLLINHFYFLGSSRTQAQVTLGFDYALTSHESTSHGDNLLIHDPLVSSHELRSPYLWSSCLFFFFCGVWPCTLKTSFCLFLTISPRCQAAWIIFLDSGIPVSLLCLVQSTGIWIPSVSKHFILKDPVRVLY